MRALQAGRPSGAAGHSWRNRERLLVPLHLASLLAVATLARRVNKRVEGHQHPDLLETRAEGARVGHVGREERNLHQRYI